MFSKVSHVGWIAVLALAIVTAAFAVSRRTRETVVFADGTVAEIKRTFKK